MYHGKISKKLKKLKEIRRLNLIKILNSLFLLTKKDFHL